MVIVMLWIFEQVIIVDDGSKDGTKRVAFDFVRKYKVDNVRVILQRKNQGKGEAIRKVSHFHMFWLPRDIFILLYLSWLISLQAYNWSKLLAYAKAL